MILEIMPRYYIDLYFQYSRNEKDTLWYLVYLDKILPKEVDNNIHLFQDSK